MKKSPFYCTSDSVDCNQIKKTILKGYGGWHYERVYYIGRLYGLCKRAVHAFCKWNGIQGICRRGIIHVWIKLASGCPAGLVLLTAGSVAMTVLWAEQPGKNYKRVIGKRGTTWITIFQVVFRVVYIWLFWYNLTYTGRDYESSGCINLVVCWPAVWYNLLYG